MFSKAMHALSDYTFHFYSLLKFYFIRKIGLCYISLSKLKFLVIILYAFAWLSPSFNDGAVYIT